MKLKVLNTKVKVQYKGQQTITQWRAKDNKIISIKDMDSQWITNVINMLERFKKKQPRTIWNYTSDWQYINRFKQELKDRTCITHNK